MRILIVDDDFNTRKLIAKILTDLGYDTLEAGNGHVALKLINSDGIRFVISDWIMPEMDGLQLCQKIRTVKRDDYTYFIMITAKDDKEALVQGMEAGADDFIHKPFNKKELKVRIRAGQRILDLQQSLVEKNLSLTKAYTIIEKDLQTASVIQKSLLPESSACIYGLRFESFLIPGSYVAGDTYNYFTIDDQHTGFYLLDVSGHGVTSALLSASLSKQLLPVNGSPLKIFKNEAPFYEVIPPAQVVANLNTTFLQKDYCEQYFTMIYGLYNKSTHQIKFCQAAHPSPLHIHKNGIHIVGDGGFPVGLVPDTEYKELAITLEVNDRLILYSDGITECKNTLDEQFGEERFIELINLYKHLELKQLLFKIQEHLKEWHGDLKFKDDISIVAFERQL